MVTQRAMERSMLNISKREENKQTGETINQGDIHHKSDSKIKMEMEEKGDDK